ncbi:MAG: flagellar export protein FliJ [Gammaproteobacteria bacterium]|nr:flagellar export protein FliJ [Gammaproteobacteria bacterium]
MKRSNKLKPVVSHAKNQEQEAARVFAEAQKRVTDSEDQLHQLENFRAEYLLKYQTLSQQQGSMSKLLDYQAFLAKLNQGIGQASNTIKLCCQQRDILKQQWVQRRTRCQALESVVVKYQQDERKKESYLEQMEQEELTQQRFFLNRN